MTEALAMLEAAHHRDDARMSATLRAARLLEADAHRCGDDNLLVQAHCYQALAYRRLRDFARAQDVLEDAQAVAVRDLPAATRAELELQLGLLEEDRGHFEAACDRYRTALPDLEGAGTQAEVRCLLAWSSALRELGDYEGSLAKLTNALKLVDAETTEWARVQDGLGQLHDAQGDYTQSVEFLEAALELLGRLDVDGERTSVRVHLAAVLLKQGRFEQAERQAQLSLGSNASDENIGRRILGEIALERGAFSVARTYLKTALKGFQRDGDEHGAGTTRRLLAATYIRLGDLDRADEYIDDADDALRLTDDTVERGLLSVVKGDLSLARARLRDALEMYSTASRYLQKSTLTLERGIAKRATAGAALMQRDLDRAAALLSEADLLVGEHQPEKIRILASTALVREERGDLHGALDVLREASDRTLDLAWDYEFASVQLSMGRIHRRLNEGAVARECFGEATTIWTKTADTANLGIVAIEVGDLVLDQHAFDAAAHQFRTAIDLLRLAERPGLTASAQRRLARVHRLQGAFETSTQLLDEATQALRLLIDSRDSSGQLQRELALARLERAELYFQQAEFNRASSESKASLSMLDGVLDQSERGRCIRLNAASLAAQGRAGECMSTLMEIGGADLIPRLMEVYRPELVERAVPLLRDHHPDGAVKEAFIVLDEALKSRVGNGRQTSEQAASWFQASARGLGEFERNELEGFNKFAVGALVAGRNRVMHKQIRMDYIESQCWVAVVNLILNYLDAPTTLEDADNA